MRRLLILIPAVTLLVPATTSAGLFDGLFCRKHHKHRCNTCVSSCNRCQASPCGCQNAATGSFPQQPISFTPRPAFQPQTQVQPQVQMVPQTRTVPQVTYRDVSRTEYRMQPETKTVPVTTYQTVTVDEGNWQKVWVPKMVQKQVPQTVYQQQTTYRQVPYQVTQRVPQVFYQTQTTMIPQYTPAVATAPHCAPCGTTTAWNGLAYPTTIAVQPQLTPYGTPQVALHPQQPVALGRELEPLSRVSSGSTAGNGLAPVPDPKYVDTPGSASREEWAPVRTASPERPSTTVPRTGSANGMFVPAPPAARVLRTFVR